VSLDASGPFQRSFLLERHVASGDLTPLVRRRGAEGTRWVPRISVRQRQLRNAVHAERFSAAPPVDRRPFGRRRAGGAAPPPILFRGDTLPLARDDDESTAVPTEDSGAEDDTCSWFDSASSSVAKDQLELDVALLGDVAGEDVQDTAVATRLTVLDECVEVRGEYRLMRHTLHDRPCYRKEDGAMFLFFSCVHQQWRFGSALGCPSDDLEAPIILEGAKLPAVGMVPAAGNSSPTRNGRCAASGSGDLEPFQPGGLQGFSRAPCTYSLEASRHTNSSDNSATIVQDEALTAAHDSADATHVTVVSDNNNIHGDYYLMHRLFNCRPCYRKEGGAVCLFFSEEHRRWRFACSLGGASPELGDDQWFTDGADLPMDVTAEAAPRSKGMRIGVTGLSVMQSDDIPSKPSQLTVIDDSDAVRGEYRLVPGLFNGRQYYRKEDGSTFLFFDDDQQNWCFGETPGGGADYGSARGSRGIAVLLPLEAGAAVVAATSHGKAVGYAMEANVGAVRLTVIDDNEQIAGEYHLLPELFRGRPCYRKGNVGPFLCFDGEGHGRFSVELGADSCDEILPKSEVKPLLMLSHPADEGARDDAVDAQLLPLSIACEHNAAFIRGSGRGDPAVASSSSPRTSCAGCMVQ